MRYIVSIMICAMLLCACPHVGLAQMVKLGYVNLSKIFEEYEKTKEYDKTLEAQGTQKQKERDKLVTEIKGLKDELELLSEKGKEEKQGQIDTKLTDLKKFDATVREELARQRDNFLKEIVEEIGKVVEEYGQKEKYTLIVRIEGVVMYGDKSIDVTDEVLKILNGRYKKK
ncbi:MAG: OmpH family outer membrane protein [Candidatus Omnitrophota bacterium]